MKNERDAQKIQGGFKEDWSAQVMRGIRTVPGLSLEGS